MLVPGFTTISLPSTVQVTKPGFFGGGGFGGPGGGPAGLAAAGGWTSGPLLAPAFAVAGGPLAGVTPLEPGAFVGAPGAGWPPVPVASEIFFSFSLTARP